jgi:hypothetical protein
MFSPNEIARGDGFLGCVRPHAWSLSIASRRNSRSLGKADDRAHRTAFFDSDPACRKYGWEKMAIPII